MGTLKLNRNSNGTKNSAEVAEAVKRAGRRVKAAVKKDFAAEALNLAAQCGYTEEQSGLRTANSVVVAGADKYKKMCKIISARPQFYLGGEGDYKKISNSLTDNGGEIVNGENSYKVAFDKDAHSGKIFDLRKGEKVITLLYGNGAQARAHDCGCVCELCADADNKVMATLYDGTQIEYLALNDRIKENIIINSRQEKYEYDFTLQIGDMTVEEGEHSDLLIKDKETGETEFIIPAPYMFDAAGVRSDKVRYEIDVNGGELAIKIIADQSFINAAERAFPVTVDPQIVVNQQAANIKFYVLETKFDENQGWTESTETDYVLWISYTDEESYEEGKVVYDIPKTYIDSEITGVITKMVMRLRCEYCTGEINIKGKVYTPKKDEIIEIDLGTTLKNDFYVYFNKRERMSAKFTFVDLIVYYAERKISEPKIKEIILPNGIKNYLDINNGVVTTAVPILSDNSLRIPLNLYQSYRIGIGENSCGRNWRLNLSKKLNISDKSAVNTGFCFTDELGNSKTLKEIYYYYLDGIKKFVSKSLVKIDFDGSLTYNGKKVYKYQSCDEYTLIPEIRDYVDSNLIEQRTNERIQLEDYVNQIKFSLDNYVEVNKSSGAVSSLGTLTNSNYEEKIDSVDLKCSTVMTEDAAYQLRAAIVNRDNLQNQINQLENELKNAESSASEDINNKISVLQQQKNLGIEQINLMIKQADKSIPLLKESYLKYFIKKSELEKLITQSPVNFLRDKNGEISGYNENGNLVLIIDGYGNYAIVEYDGNGEISAISDKNGTFIKFNYADGLLKSITDNSGHSVEYAYDKSNQLSMLTYSDGSVLKFEYQSQALRSITNENGQQIKFSYDETKRLITQAINAKKTPVLGARIESVDGYKTVNITRVVYGVDINGKEFTEISGGECDYERYTFNSFGQVEVCETQDNRFVKNAITFIYDDIGNVIKKSTRQNGEVDEREELYAYDGLSRMISKESNWQSLSDAVKVKSLTVYAYNDDDKIVKITTVQKMDESGTINEKTAVTKYHYNAQGQLTLTESFVEGEEKTSGINFEEKVYNDDGNVVKYIRWNSLNSSTKFYEECEVDEKGRVTSKKDEAGEVSAEYAYSGGEVNSVKLANGSTLAYGRNYFSGEVTGVTQSTEQGEENATEITYNYGLPVKVQSGNTALEYTYDYTRRKSNVSVNGATQVSYAYQDYNFNASQRKCRFSEVTATYADGTKVVESRTGQMNANNVLCLTEEYKVNGVTRLKKTYDEKDRLTSITDSVKGTRTYTYDNYDNITSVTINGFTENYAYDSYGLLKSKAYSGTVTHAYSYTYKDNAAKELESISVLGYDFKPLTDVNGRNTGKEIYSGANKVAGEYITYRKIGDRATNMPATVWYATGNKINESIKYTYDRCGNISEIRENGHLKTKYTYDSLNRLIREDNKYCGTTFVFSYDLNGNITERCEYPYTLKRGEELEELECTHYTYDYEGDKLVNYNGETFAYNAVGNPTIYRGKTANWLYGKLLANYNGVNFAYNGAGQRISKGGITYTYDSDGKLIKQSNGLEFIYDASGVAGVVYNEVKYFYRKDAQGNVIAIINGDGGLIARYEYDAWGNHVVTDKDGNPITSGIGELNPFRYRGYYYDTETELYYLQTRYYDPELGRFISQDSIEYAEPETINGLNLYAYCGNNPVMNIDPTGTLFLALFLGITALIGLGLTIGGVASGNKTLTAVGLTMVAVPALISGGMALVSGIVAGATFTGVVGGITVAAGLGTGLFASAEIQQASGHGNWMLDAGMSEELYYGLMLAFATVATAGTAVSSFANAFKIDKILKIGKLIPSNHPEEGFYGILFKNARGATMSFELQFHAPHGLHFQLNSWNPWHFSVSTKKIWSWFFNIWK